MRASSLDIDLALRGAGGVISRQQHPDLAGALDQMVRRQQLVALLPGIYCAPALAQKPEVRVRAASLWDPDLVFTGPTAARLSFWPELKTSAITAALPSKRRAPAGFEFCRRLVRPELVVERRGLRMTSPALTALDLCDGFGGDGIDAALRSRQASLAGLHEALALTGARNGNLRRRTLLRESRDEPWSKAEREGHKLLRAWGIAGWKANVPLETRGVVFYLDVAFRRQRLAVEIDGREHHSSPFAFEHDRWRQNEIVLAGWRVLRFTWDMIVNDSELVIEQLRRALALGAQKVTSG